MCLLYTIVERVRRMVICTSVIEVTRSMQGARRDYCKRREEHAPEPVTLTIHQHAELSTLVRARFLLATAGFLARFRTP